MMIRHTLLNMSGMMLLILAHHETTGFFLPIQQSTTTTTISRRGGSSLVVLDAKKKKKGNKGGKGFGKAPPPPPPPSPAPKTTMEDPFITSSNSADSLSSSSLLQSVETGGSDSIPVMDTTTTTTTGDSELSSEERAKKLLREQYGLRTAEEQAMEESIQASRKRLNELKAMADEDEDIDLMAMLPAPLLKGIDTFLKLGVATCTILFVSAGLAITVEAWSKASGNELPANVDSFIADIIEPNFTTGLFVLLGFSICLGAFAALQLSSSAATYKEE